MKQQTWFIAEIAAIPQAAEAIEFALNEIGSLGTEINNLGKKDSEYIRIIGYYEKEPNREFLQNKILESLNIYNLSKDLIKNIEFKQIKNQDWLQEWKKHWKPTETKRFMIAPTWENVEDTEKILIRIEPSMAFGTGTHETTKLCLKAIEENYNNGMNFLDVGTGTGILSIAVAKLNSGNVCKILGFDIDEDSIKIAKENAKLNKTEEIELYVGSISSETPEFDFVCANVTADVIIPMLPLLIAKTKKTLVLSGILVEQERQVFDELEKLKIENVETEKDGEWMSFLLRRKEF